MQVLDMPGQSLQSLLLSAAKCRIRSIMPVTTLTNKCCRLLQPLSADCLGKVHSNVTSIDVTLCTGLLS